MYRLINFLPFLISTLTNSTHKLRFQSYLIQCTVVPISAQVHCFKTSFHVVFTLSDLITEHEAYSYSLSHATFLCCFHLLGQRRVWGRLWSSRSQRPQRGRGWVPRSHWASARWNQAKSHQACPLVATHTSGCACWTTLRRYLTSLWVTVSYSLYCSTICKVKML